MHIYMKHQWKNQHRQTVFAAIISPAHSTTECSEEACCNTAEKQFTFLQMIHHIITGPLAITPNVSLTITRHLQGALPRGRSHC